MVHTIVYLGRYNLNFDRLRSHNGAVNDFIMLDGEGTEKPAWKPSPKVDGIVFGYMEKGYEGVPQKEAYYCEAVGDVVLEKPIMLIPDRHTDGKRYGPASSQFGDVSAKTLLRDTIEQNPNQASQLEEIQHEFFGSLQG